MPLNDYTGAAAGFLTQMPPELVSRRRVESGRAALPLSPSLSPPLLLVALLSSRS